MTPAHRAAFVDLPAQGSLALRKVEIRLGLLVCLCELPDSARKCWNVQLLNPDVSVSLLALWERMQKSEPNLQPGLKLGAPQRWFCSPPASRRQCAGHVCSALWDQLESEVLFLPFGSFQV